MVPTMDMVQVIFLRVYILGIHLAGSILVQSRHFRQLHLVIHVLSIARQDTLSKIVSGPGCG